VKEAFERQDLLFLDPLGFANQYVLVAKRERGWKTLSDLTEGLSLAIDPELAVREDFRILCTHYALSSKPKLMDQVLLAFSLQSGAIDVMSGFSTEPRLLDEEFIILEDDKGVLPAYVAAPLIRKETIEEHPELLAVFAMLKNQITSEQVAQLSQQVELGQRAPQAVVADYLARVALKPPVQREPRQR
jgi:glycine betaine/choline ABC-type transport system substrate-binding protein